FDSLMTSDQIQNDSQWTIARMYILQRLRGTFLVGIGLFAVTAGTVYCIMRSREKKRQEKGNKYATPSFSRKKKMTSKESAEESAEIVRKPKGKLSAELTASKEKKPTGKGTKEEIASPRQNKVFSKESSQKRVDSVEKVEGKHSDEVSDAGKKDEDKSAADESSESSSNKKRQKRGWFLTEIFDEAPSTQMKLRQERMKFSKKKFQRYKSGRNSSEEKKKL
ncbi:hypothetical protein V3C99_006241, partial [Haemonchus contortus]